MQLSELPEKPGADYGNVDSPQFSWLPPSSEMAG